MEVQHKLEESINRKVDVGFIDSLIFLKGLNQI